MYEYQMIQVPPNISVESKSERGNEAAAYLQQIANQHASQGWEFYRVDVVGVVATPGCIAGLLGQKSTTTDYYVVTFRRARG